MLGYSIEENLKPKNLTMFLTKPNRETIAKLKHVKQENLGIYFENEVDTLSFTLPYYIKIDKKQIKNPHIDKVKTKFLIKAFLGDEDKPRWFIVDKINKVSDNSEDLQVTCYSSEYSLSRRKTIKYEVTGSNCLMTTNDTLKGTVWKAGYINPEFNLEYRKFEISQQTRLDTLYQIADTFEAIVVFDTDNLTVNYYKEEELSKYKGFKIGYGKYIQNINEEIDGEKIVTRLHVRGSNGLTINSVNPTGKTYIDDYSYFLYPFKMDDNGEVIAHSDHGMSDSLAKALVTYNKKVSEKNTHFYDFLQSKQDLQKELTEKNNKLVELEVELQIILDEISINKDIDKSNTELNKKRNGKNKEISKQKSDIKEIENQIGDIDKQVEELNQDINLENNLTEEQLVELSEFTNEDEWIDDNHFDENDLYEAGVEELSKINEPPVNITTNIVNFFKMTSEKHNWSRLGIGDIIKIEHEPLGIDVKTTVSYLGFNFDDDTIDINISNSEKPKDIIDKFVDAFYRVDKVETESNKRKRDWNRIAYNYNLRNDRIKETPTNPTSTNLKHKENDDGSVNLILKWKYPNYLETEKKEDNIDGFLIYLYYSDDNDPYQFGSKESEETIFDIPYSSHTHTFPSVPSNLFYTIGVRAYRKVDDDINVEGIIMSDIVYFNSESISPISLFSTFPQRINSNISNLQQSEDDGDGSPLSPYQPKDSVDFKGTINGLMITSKDDIDINNPTDGQIAFDKETGQWVIWDAKKIEWVPSPELENLKQELEDNKKHVEEAMEQVEKELEDTNKELEEELKKLDEEMKYLEEETLLNVENAVEETKIPEFYDDPDEIPLSGLYWDMSQEPPRMMRWNEDEGRWAALSPNEKDIEDMMKKMREESVQESYRYSKVDIIRTRKNIEEKIQNEIGKIQGDIGELLEIKDELIETAETIDELLDEYNGKFTDFEHRVDEVEGLVGTTITNIERIDGVVEGHTSSIEQNAEAISQRVSSIEYERDKTDILSNIEENQTAINLLSDEIDLRVTKDEWENFNEDFDERISSAEVNITLNSEAIELKAEKSELTNYVDKQVYNNKIGELDVSINDITGRVESTQTEFDDFKTGDYTLFKQQYGEFKLEVDNFTTKIGELSDIDGTLIDSFSEVKQEVGSITSTIQAVETGVGENFEEYLISTKTTIEQLPDEINLAVTEGIGNLEISGRNLVSNSRGDTLSGWNAWGRNNIRIAENYLGHDWIWASRDSQSQIGVETPVFKLEADKTYTVSFIIRSRSNSGYHMNYIYLREGNKDTATVKRLSDVDMRDTKFKGDISGDGVRVWFEVKHDADIDDARILLGISDRPENAGYVIRELQIEKGNKATDWSPAPEDGVNKTNVLSSINLSTEGIKIEGVKIDIKGLVSVLNADGSTGTMIDGGKIVASSLTANELNINNIFGNSAVISKIQADSVKTASLDAGKITAGTLNAARIASSSITAAKIATNAIVADKIAANAVTTAKINSRAITATKIATGTITANEVASNAITAAKIAANAVTAGKINVTNLSALSADLGEVTAGVIKGVSIEGGIITQSGSEGKVVLDKDGLKKLDKNGKIRVAIGNENWNVDNWSPSSLVFNPEDSEGFAVIVDGVGLGDAFIGYPSGGYTNSQLNISNSKGTIAFESKETRVQGQLSLTSRSVSGGAAFANSDIDYMNNRIHVITSNTNNKYLVVYPQRYSGQDVFRIRSHDQKSGYRDDFRLNSSGEIISTPTSDNRVTWAGRVAIGSTTGRMGFVSSTRKLKLNIANISSNPYDILNINPSSWYDKKNTEEYADLLSKKHLGKPFDQEKFKEIEKIRRIPGLIAEEVYEAGLKEFVEYDDNGEINGVMYERIPILFVPILKDLIKQIKNIEGENKLKSSQILTLKRRIEFLESQIL